MEVFYLKIIEINNTLHELTTILINKLDYKQYF